MSNRDEPNQPHRACLEAVRDAIRIGGRKWLSGEHRNDWRSALDSCASEIDALLSRPEPAPVEGDMPTRDCGHHGDGTVSRAAAWMAVVREVEDDADWTYPTGQETVIQHIRKMKAERDAAIQRAEKAEAALAGMRRSVSEALNTGDGSYKP